MKCQFKSNVASDVNVSRINSDINTSDTVNHDILNALTSVSSRLTAIEHHIQKTEDYLQMGATSLSDGMTSPVPTVSSHRSREIDSDKEDDVVNPTTAFLKSSRGIQKAVDK